MKILVVDDSETMRSLIGRTLKEIGFSDYVMAESGEKAIEALEKERPDVVLLDWHMPGLSGMDCLRYIRNNEKTRDLPVIMLTVEAHSRSVQEAMETGAAGYIVKPLKPDVLKEKLKELEIG